MIGIIAGANFSVAGWENAERRAVETPYGQPSEPISLASVAGKRVALLFRHGSQRIPPHRINHRANLSALLSLEVSRVIGVNSVGSLKRDIPPGSIVIPHDFLCPWQVLTFHQDRAIHITPTLSQEMRAVLVRAASEAEVKFQDGGIYIQTLGPRLETEAEVAMLSQFGDVVGMTMAHEATLSQELGLPYASLCSVDNFAHGLIDMPLLAEEIARGSRESLGQIQKVLFRALENME